MKDELFQLFAGGVRLLRALPSPPSPLFLLLNCSLAYCTSTQSLHEYLHSTSASILYCTRKYLQTTSVRKLNSQIFANKICNDTVIHLQIFVYTMQPLHWYCTWKDLQTTSALILYLYLQTTSALILYLQIFANNLCIDILLANICKQHLH